MFNYFKWILAVMLSLSGMIALVSGEINNRGVVEPASVQQGYPGYEDSKVEVYPALTEYVLITRTPPPPKPTQE
jgi:hypothetical protein